MDPRETESPPCSLDILAGAVESKPPAFFRSAVRNMYLSLQSTNAAQAQIIFAACTGVTNDNLALISSLSLQGVPAIGSLPLRRLITCTSWLFVDLPLDFTHSLFRSITHLTLFDVRSGYRSVEWEKLVVDIPHLTHLALYTYHLAVILVPVLPTCARLECVLFAGTAGQHPLAHTADERFVVVQLRMLPDWQAGARGAEDHWTRAEPAIWARGTRTLIAMLIAMHS
ncbi:hypothetical protein C8R43DRAFT_613678 [Mycena crocata]|nr:hypothetical protein C8R43DRAFT_613678 [Mycena crocata]